MTQAELVGYKPNPGPQEVFLSTPADIAIYGGLPGGGKSHGLLLEMLRHMMNPKFIGVIIRRIREDITKAGGIWDFSKRLYGPLKTRVNNSSLTHEFPAGGMLAFGSMKDARSDHERYKSVEIDVVGVEELTELEEHQFWYMLSRNRGKARSGIRSYLRATTNPKAGWVFRLLRQAGYVDADGFAIPEMSGVIRWFFRDEDTDILQWFDSEAEALVEIAERELVDVAPMSFTFILASAKDNPYQDEDYVSKLGNLNKVDRERLKNGNWKIETDEGGMFKRDWWCTALKPPKKTVFKQVVRSWDIAATPLDEKKKNDPAYTASVLEGITEEGRFWFLHAERFRGTPATVRKRMLATAQRDRANWGNITTTIPNDPAAGGKFQCESLAANLKGFTVKIMPLTGNKAARAEGLANDVENGLVTVLIDETDEEECAQALMNEGATFPYGAFKDLIDAAGDAHDHLTERQRTPTKSFKSRRRL